MLSLCPQGQPYPIEVVVWGNKSVYLTGKRIAMVDMDLLVFFQHFHIDRRGGWSQSFPLKIFFSCCLGGGGGGGGGGLCLSDSCLFSDACTGALHT